MPELCRFQGIIIRMLFNDRGTHNKPHIHVEYGGYFASVGLDGELLAGSLPEKKLVLVKAWLILHEQELYIAWNNAVRNLPLTKIEPLE